MSSRIGLRTITLDAARCLGVDDRIGSIEVGKDADILILDGDPLHYKTFVLTAIVNGKVVYEKDKATFYSHIRPVPQPGPKPVAAPVAAPVAEVDASQESDGRE
jgi:cytosine/adenosine deaminase-related metal-dependent hydrolase